MAEIIDHWLKSRKTATIEEIQLVPKRHPLLPEIALSTIRGQAEAFYTEESGTGKKWILKKFLPGRNPDIRYIHAIQSILPSHIGFESGFQRKVLTKSSLTGNGFHKHDFREPLHVFESDRILRRAIYRNRGRSR